MLLLNAGVANSPSPESRENRISIAVHLILKAFHADTKPVDLSVPSICDLHRRLFQFSPEDLPYGGRLRDPEDRELEKLLIRLADRLNDNKYHLLFSLSRFRHAFLRLMPFITANGLLVNILCYFLLVQNEYGFVMHLPFLTALSKPGPDLSGDPFLLLSETIVHVLRDYKTLRQPVYLNIRRQKVSDLISHGGAPMKISDIMKYFPEENRNTIKKDLLFLKEKRFITASGSGRGMVYLSAAPPATI
ncbi:MAG: hypothetical protein K0B52_01145 [FCB group bacterium]|nr:hypothetical protein [FCB group bacterium]